MLDLEQVIARLEAMESAPGTKLFRQVGGAADLASLKGVVRKHPAAFVLPESERSDPPLAGSTLQTQATRFSVVLVVKNRRDPRGEAAQQEFKPVREILLSSAGLLGWTPDSAATCVIHAAGDINDFDDASLYWIDAFETTTTIGG